MKQLLKRLYNAARHPEQAVSAVTRRYRVSRAGSHPELQEFWKQQGREWMTLEATVAEISFFDKLSAESSQLSAAATCAVVSAAFRKNWNDSFQNPEERIDWNLMAEGLPDAALLAFFVGAGEARSARSHVSA